MDKELIAGVLLALGAVALSGAVAVFPSLRRVYLCLFFLSPFKVVDINFVSRENYRGWVRGFEIGSFDMLLVALLASVLLGWRDHRPRFLPALSIPIAIYVVAVVASAFGAFVPLYSAFGLLKILRYAVAFWVITNAVRDETDLRWVVWALVAAAALQASDAIRDYLKGVYRVRAVFDHPNTLAMYLNMLLPLLLSLLLNLRSRWQWVYLGVFGIGAGAVVLTLSRGAWISLGLATLVVLPVSFALRFRPGKLGIVGLMVLLAIPPGILAVQKMVRRIREAPESSGEARVMFNRVARQMARDHTFGVGINNYSYGTDEPYSEPFAGGLDQGGLCHNLYFITLGETGWAGVLALGGILVAAYTHVVRFLLRSLHEDLRSVFQLGWLGGLITVTFQSTLEWAMLQTSLAMTFYGLLAVSSAVLRMKPGARVTRWRVNFVPAPAASPQWTGESYER